MRRIIKTIIESVKEYNNAMWGDGGCFDSLAGEEIGFDSEETENKCDRAWNNLKSIYGMKKGIPHNNTLIRRGLTKDGLETIELVKKVLESNKG